jgi:virulence factor
MKGFCPSEQTYTAGRKDKMGQVPRLGMISCDTSHVVQFTMRLNHVGITEDQWVNGAQVVAAVPGSSLVSPERIPGFVQQLRGFGVEILERPEDLLGRVDAVLVEANDGSVHAELALRFVEASLPVFVDKPFATTVEDARRMVQAAQTKGSPLFSASSLRYALELQRLRRDAAVGRIVGADVYGPASLHPRNPGLFNYGVHAVEMLYELMGTGCESVRCVFEEGAEVVVGRWGDGRLGTVRGTRSGAYSYGFTAFGEKLTVPVAVDARYIYRELLKVIVGMLNTSSWPLSAEELIEPVAFQVAAYESAQRRGEGVRLAGG